MVVEIRRLHSLTLIIPKGGVLSVIAIFHQLTLRDGLSPKTRPAMVVLSEIGINEMVRRLALPPKESSPLLERICAEHSAVHGLGY